MDLAAVMVDAKIYCYCLMYVCVYTYLTNMCVCVCVCVSRVRLRRRIVKRKAEKFLTLSTCLAASPVATETPVVSEHCRTRLAH